MNKLLDEIFEFGVVGVYLKEDGETGGVAGLDVFGFHGLFLVWDVARIGVGADGLLGAWSVMC